MKNSEFTKLLYVNQFKFNDYNLPNGFIDYHKNNFKRYFKIENFKGKTVLDSGCGIGKHSAVLALLGAKVLGADFCKANIKKAQVIKNKYKLKNLSFIVYDFNKPLKEEFDLISAHNWIQHTPNPAKIIQNLAKSLKNGGRLYISTYLAGTFRHLITKTARNVLRRNDYNLMKRLTPYYFPIGLKTFKNPDNICFENLLDDFFVPYCHFFSYDELVSICKGLKPITPIPKLNNLSDIDNLPLRIGFIK